VGSKSSSAYLPPEAIFVDSEKNKALIRSEIIRENEGYSKNDFSLLLAHPSFDIWSLGCVLYQLCTPDVRQLFQVN
jgi:serine/threonine protein kinase